MNAIQFGPIFNLLPQFVNARMKKFKQNIKFYDSSKKIELNDIWNLIDLQNIKKFNPCYFEENIKKGLLNRSNFNPLFDSVYTVYEGMTFNNNLNKFVDKYFVPNDIEIDYKSFLLIVEKYFENFEGKKIAVQLSGGLDSSIIIGLLEYFNIPFCLVGMSSTRYEFRTERHIQNTIASKTDKVVLIDYEEHLPFTTMDIAPISQTPDLSIINLSADNAMANACKELGVDILFSGFGGDVLFATEVPIKNEDCNWKPQLFYDSWIIDLVYAPNGVQLVPFYADIEIMKAIYNLRRGMKEDISKKWARLFFKDLIPEELAKYTYVADFWGLYISGLLDNIETFRYNNKLAYETTHNNYFAEKEFQNHVINKDLLSGKKNIYQPIEARISFSAWINVLYKNGILK